MPSSSMYISYYCFCPGAPLTTALLLVPVAPVPAAVAFPLPMNFFTAPPILPITTRANHGVPHTLSINRAGNTAFVIAYAVATSTKILLPPSENFHTGAEVGISGSL